MAGVVEIAEKAGVSPATVSRALRGLHHVNEATRSKIVAAAISDLTTDNLTEGSSNQYYANSLVDTHLADATSSKTLNNVQIDGGSI